MPNGRSVRRRLVTDAVDFLAPSDVDEGDPTKVRRSKDGRPEEWLHFDACPGYWVSNYGRVKSPHRILKTPPSGSEYRTFRARTVDNVMRTFNVHAVVMLVFVGPRPAGLEVRHLNSDRTDCRLSNLAYGTPAENSADTLAAGNHWPSRATACLNGHEYEEGDVYRGGRHCRECARVRRAKWKAKQ